MTRQSEPDAEVFLSTVTPDRGERRLAGAAVVVSTVIFIAIAPFAKTALAPVWAFIPVYQSAAVVNDFITAILLFGQFTLLRSRALLALAGGYLFTAFTAAAHMLTFPGLFAPAGLLGAGPQTTAWLYMLWHAGFPAAVLAYAALGRADRAAAPMRMAPPVAIALCAAAAAAATAGATLLATAGHEVLPAIMQGNHYTPAMAGVVTATWALNLVALATLWMHKPHTVLDLWIMVVLCACIFDIALAAVLNAGRFDVGFYAGRLFGLLASGFVLVVLLLENGVLYARLARALAGEQAERRRAEEKTAQLNELNASLEERVALRTQELDRANRELQEVAALGATAREQEKTRIAREMHDELGQALTALRIDLGWLEQHGADEPANARIAGMRSVLDGTVAATRRIAADLRPLMLDDLGFVAAAQWLAQNFQERHGIACSMEIDAGELELADPHATAVFRIIQESLTNVARHAQATLVEVDVSLGRDAIRVRVRDNGRGFDPSRPRKAGSFGLTGLRERAYLVGGHIEIDSAPGRGTTIEVHIPLRRDERGAAPAARPVVSSAGADDD